MTTRLAVPLFATRTIAEGSARRLEPVTAGIPFPRGAATSAGEWRLIGPGHERIPLQTEVIERWPDGSTRWLLIDTQVDLASSQDRVPLLLEYLPPGHRQEPIASTLELSEDPSGITVNTGPTRVRLAPTSKGVLESCSSGIHDLLESSDVILVDDAGARWDIHWETPVATVVGPVRVAVCTRGSARAPSGRSLSLEMELEFFEGHGVARVRLMARNPNRASHPGGIWELGDSGSVLLRELSLSLRRSRQSSHGSIRWWAGSDDSGLAERHTSIYQDSSGGENWQSTNHLNRLGQTPIRFRGYEVSSDDGRHRGLRAAPVILTGETGAELGIAAPQFWENFPKVVSASRDELRFSMFPSESMDVHELQGGEQKTHECYIAFGPDTVSDTPLEWCHSRLVLHAEPRWYAESSAVPYFVVAADEDQLYRSLVDAAIEGADTFIAKREVADEYGWRHFGDIYGDHEAVKHKGPTPLMSHYNNQYDPIAGCLYQFMRTGDTRWWALCRDLASHVIDIDLYHTNDDAAKYNNGLFWHTCHYIDAAKSTHRSYPSGTNGGGPSSEQNYTTGLLLYHRVSGSRHSRDAALSLASFVINIDDGERTIFRWMAKGYTGVASASRTPDYHGPGRGSANSLNALLDGHRITGDRKYLDKAEQIVRRVTHPRQDIERLGLLDPENRWFYTMYLQSLAKYLEYKVELGERDAMYAYGRDVLLHFARWMATHERPYLSRPDLLEFPTETWPAQDIRKSEVFDAAARYVEGDERKRFLERAEYFFAYCTTTLSGMPTRSLARPVVLLMAHGWRRAYASRHGVDPAPEPVATWNELWPVPEPFVPQKVRAIRRAKALVAVAGLIALAAMAAMVRWLLA